eukprot:1799160-Pyramimonas_sp.AAC.1
MPRMLRQSAPSPISIDLVRYSFKHQVFRSALYVPAGTRFVVRGGSFECHTAVAAKRLPGLVLTDLVRRSLWPQVCVWAAVRMRSRPAPTVA